jgi:transcriptional regulator with GAF, ATPase, and Fis domain
MSHDPTDASIDDLPPEAVSAAHDRAYTVEVNVNAATELIHVDKCKLVVANGPDDGKELIFDKPIVRIGTNEKNDLVLTDNTVSRYHCEIRMVGDEYLLVDHDSTNGTFVGELRVREAYLYPNCEMLVGNTLVRFVPLVEEIPVFPVPRAAYKDLIGNASRMREIYGIIDKVAPSELSCVIEGETGTGKELVARALHSASRRSKGPLVIFDCSAFPENLLESELFGHEKGAFSGAMKTHRGVFERADGGTVFLDELGEMSINLQPKFLRALESGEIRRVGGERTIKVDVRVIAATNRNLATLCEEGKFRTDLFYRLAKVRFELPPLRKRKEDLPLLIDHFLRQLHSRNEAQAVRGFSPDVLEVLQRYDFPGNVRELRNVVERSATFCEHDLIGLDDLPHELQARIGATDHGVSSVIVPNIDGNLSMKEAKERMVAQFERDYLVQLLERHNMNISKVAREAGIDRRHVYRLMKKYEIDLPDRDD